MNNLSRISLIRGKCSQTGIYTLFPPVNFNCACCCPLRWLSRGNRCRATRRSALYISSSIPGNALVHASLGFTQVILRNVQFDCIVNFTNNTFLHFFDNYFRSFRFVFTKVLISSKFKRKCKYCMVFNRL